MVAFQMHIFTLAMSAKVLVIFSAFVDDKNPILEFTVVQGL
jgi:hypothetical protein